MPGWLELSKFKVVVSGFGPVLGEQRKTDKR
jgi:hypothetical protein